MIPLLIGPVSELLNTVLKRVLPAEKMSEGERVQLEAQVQAELLKADWTGVQAQLQVNAEEAKHESVFVSGWRPFVGWVCGAALAYHFVVQPFLAFAVQATGATLPPLPQLDAATLSPILLGMLGLGGMRSFEKYAGVNKKR